MGREGRTAPGTIPGASLNSRAAASFAQQEDISGRLGTVEVGATKGFILQATDVVEAEADGVGGALGGASGSSAVPLEVN